MARALFSADQVHEAADSLAAEGKEVTALNMLARLGGGSLTTIYKHLITWREAKQQALAPSNSNTIPDTVQAAFSTAIGRAWFAATSEAAKEIALIKEKTAEEVNSANKQFEEAMQVIERLEDQATADTERIDELKLQVTDLQNALHREQNEKAALTATTEQLQIQLRSKDSELERIQKDYEAQRKEREQSLTQAAELRGQLDILKQQNAQLLERIGKPGRT